MIRVNLVKSIQHVEVKDHVTNNIGRWYAQLPSSRERGVIKVSEETTTVTFEEAMDQLETIVERLEEGDVPLEEAITIYKKGMELSKLCHDKLKNVEEQLTQILTADGHKETFAISRGGVNVQNTQLRLLYKEI